MVVRKTGLLRPPVPVRPGRPAADPAEVRQKLLSVATEVLLAEGLAGFSVEKVAKAAHVAKKTVYAVAPNREALVGTIVANWTDQLAKRALLTLSLPYTPGQAQEMMKRFLTDVCSVALSTEAISLFRLIAGSDQARKKLMKPYNENGIERGRALLAAWLYQLQIAGKLPAMDCPLYASVWLSAVVAEPLRQAAIGLRKPWPDGVRGVSTRIQLVCEDFRRLLEEKNTSAGKPYPGR